MISRRPTIEASLILLGMAPLVTLTLCRVTKQPKREPVMTKMLLAVVVLAAVSASGQRAFNGTWRANNQSMEYQGSNQYWLQNGIWRCNTCVPKIAIKADGREYRINSSLYYGAPYAETESVREVNDHSIEITDKLAGKIVATNKL